MHLNLKRKSNTVKLDKHPYEQNIDPNSPYFGLSDKISIYQKKNGEFLTSNQQPTSTAPRKYDPHQTTRYKNVILGENGIAKCYDVKTGGLNETDKVLPELYTRREECCGCGACYAICPTRKFLENDGSNSIGKHGEHYLLPHGDRKSVV